MTNNAQVLRRFARFEDVGKGAWDALVGRSEFPSVFQSFGWLSSWWDTFREPSWDLLLLGAVDGDRLVGLAPLYSAPAPASPGRSRITRFVGDEHADYSTFILEHGRPDLVERYIEELQRLARRRSRVELPEVPENTTLARTLRAMNARRVSRVDFVGETVCPRLVLAGNEGAANKVLRKDSLKRHSAKLRKLGVVTVEHLTEPEQIVPLLDPFFHQHIARWSVTAYPSLFASEKNREFYRRFVRALAPDGYVIFTVLKLDGNPVAFHLGFRSSGEFYWYKPSFEIRLARVSPGEVLLGELFAMASSARYRAFDFLRGDEPFKRRFASTNQKNLNFVIRASALERSVFRAGRWTKQAIRKALVASRLEPLVTSARANPRPGNSLLRLARVGVRIGGATISSVGRWGYSHACVKVFMAEPEPKMSNAPRGSTPNVVEADLDVLLEGPIFSTEAQRTALLQVAFPRLRGGDKCYIVLVEGRLAGYAWSTTKSPMQVNGVGLPLPFSAGEVMLYDPVILPEYSGRGLYEILLQGIRGLSASETHWIFAEAGNWAALQGIQRAGFSHAFSLKRRIVFGRSTRHRLNSAPAATKRPSAI